MGNLATGAGGFIGSAVVRMLVEHDVKQAVNVDCLTFAGNLDSLDAIAGALNYARARHT